MDVVHIKRKYKDRMLALAFIVSGWSPEPDGQRHGAVIALDGKFIVATGFNGPDRDSEDEKPGIVHAEVNALINLEMVGMKATGCVAYVTKRPCEDCHKALVAAGVDAIFWLQDCSGDGCVWTAPWIQ